MSKPREQNPTSPQKVPATNKIHCLRDTLTNWQYAFNEINNEHQLGDPIYDPPEPAADALAEEAFMQCRALLEAAGLTDLLKTLKEDYLKAKEQGFQAARKWEGREYSVWIEKLNCYVAALLSSDAAALPQGNWSRPMTYTDMAVRLFKDPTKWRLVKSQYGDRLRPTKSRKLHQICLDGFPQEVQDDFDKR